MRPLIAALPVTFAIGCLSVPSESSLEPVERPMQAWIAFLPSSTPHLPIYVNRAAYVALFEIIPDRGVTLLYPQTERFEYAHDIHFVNLKWQPGRMMYANPIFALANQPRYYYLVASATPLNLTRLQESLGGVRRVLGRHYLAKRPYDVIERLTNYVVPRQPDHDWATDLIVDWPVMPARPQHVYRQVVCANGRILIVDALYPFHGCPGDARVTVVAPTAPTDSATPKEVTPVEPRPRLPEVRHAEARAAVDDRPARVPSRRAEARARVPVERGIPRHARTDPAGPSSPRLPSEVSARSPGRGSSSTENGAVTRRETGSSKSTPEPARSPSTSPERESVGKARKPDPRD
jgi:hypothetical protein